MGYPQAQIFSSDHDKPKAASCQNLRPVQIARRSLNGFEPFLLDLLGAKPSRFQ
jgi:hypothetical protein